MKKFFISLILAVFCVSVPQKTAATESLPLNKCGDRPEVYVEPVIPLYFENLPKRVLVARVAHLWIQSKDGQLKLEVKHNFKSGSREFVCSTMEQTLGKEFAIFAPALIDRTLEQKTGSTIWQFLTSVNGGKIGIWNKKTNLVAIGDFLDSRKMATASQWSEDGVIDYRLRIHRQVGDFDLLLVVEYDLL